MISMIALYQSELFLNYSNEDLEPFITEQLADAAFKTKFGRRMESFCTIGLTEAEKLKEQTIKFLVDPPAE